MLTLLNKPIGSIGFGLMRLSWNPTRPSEETSLSLMSQSLKLGANFWNGGEFYSNDFSQFHNLRLINDYFVAHPEDKDKVVLSIKGAINTATFQPTGDDTSIRASVDNCLKYLQQSGKSIDLFELARVDPKVPIEESIRTLAALVKEGKIGGISLSEVNANTIRRAAAIHPIAAVELEVSLWATEIWENGTVEACRELGIPIVAYSPLGRGFLTGDVRSFNDIPEDDFRRSLDRFQPDVFDKNLVLVDRVSEVAKRTGIPNAQLAIGWLKRKGERSGVRIIPIPGATSEKRMAESLTSVEISEKDMDDIDEIIKGITIIGGRYNKHQASMLEL